MSVSKITIARLAKEEKLFQQEDSPNLIVSRPEMLVFHFCIYHLPSPYTDGFYHGVVKLPEDYPFSPPQITFLTPNGRFMADKSICTTFTNFHKNKWSHIWTIRTMLLGIISLMMDSNEKGIGFLNMSDEAKQAYASQSLAFNMKNEEFKKLFQEKLQKMDINISQLVEKGKKDSVQQNSVSETTNKEIKIFENLLKEPIKQQQVELLYLNKERRRAKQKKARMERVEERRMKRRKHQNEKQEKDEQNSIVSIKNAQTKFE